MCEIFYFNILIIIEWDGTSGNELTCHAGDIKDAVLTPRLGRSPGGGQGKSLKYSCLENTMDRGAWWATVHRLTKSQM